MRIEKFSFGHITINGVTYEHDVVIDHGKIRKRLKSRRRNCGMPSAIRRCLRQKRSHGSAAGSSSVPGLTATCRLRMM